MQAVLGLQLDDLPLALQLLLSEAVLPLLLDDHHVLPHLDRRLFESLTHGLEVLAVSVQLGSGFGLPLLHGLEFTLEVLFHSVELFLMVFLQFLAIVVEPLEDQLLFLVHLIHPITHAFGFKRQAFGLQVRVEGGLSGFGEFLRIRLNGRGVQVLLRLQPQEVISESLVELAQLIYLRLVVHLTSIYIAKLGFQVIALCYLLLEVLLAYL